MRLIDADVLINRVVFHTDWSTDEKEAFEDEVNAEPTVDAIEIIKCKDCKHRILNKLYPNRGFKYYCDLDTGDPWELGRIAENDDWFCADAERREA